VAVEPGPPTAPEPVPAGLRKAAQEEALARVPTPHLGVVAHVGNLEGPRAPGGWSHEGGGLSVSQHPEAWRRIAKLGAGDVWILRKASPCFYEVPNPLPKAVTDWCVKEGFLVPRVAFKITVFDDELGCELNMEFGTREEAEFELNALDQEDRTIEEVDGFGFGERGLAYCREVFGEVGEAIHQLAGSYAPIFWAEDQGFDGCWWHEEYDPVCGANPFVQGGEEVNPCGFPHPVA
jgi:hypothetical protein